MKKNLPAQGITLAILGAALAASGAAYATGSDTAPRFKDRGGHHAFHHHGHYGAKGMHSGRYHAHMHRAGMVVPGYGVVSRDFVDGMGLSDEQLKLIEDARETAKEQREKRRDAIKGERATRMDLFKADALDPEQALKQADERRAQAQAERRQVDEKWIAVWKSLDSGQQARVASHLKERAEKAQKRAEKFEERKQKREEARAERQGRDAS